MYDFGVQELMKGNVDLINDTLSAVVLSASYSPVLASDEYQTDIPDAAILDEIDLSGQEITGTVFNADPVTFTDVDSGESVAGVAMLKNTGDTSTSILIAYFVVTPFTTDGTSVIVNWHADGIIEL